MAAWAEVLHRGIEGYVAKDPESSYVGGRSLKWLKVKVPKYREEENRSNRASLRHCMPHDNATQRHSVEWRHAAGGDSRVRGRRSFRLTSPGIHGTLCCRGRPGILRL